MVSRGFITVAQNTLGIDYVRLAYGLALSLKITQREYAGLTVMVTPGTEIDPKYRDAFDHVVEIPWGDLAKSDTWKLANRWKVIHASPYDQTVLLDADMLIPHDMTDYWGMWRNRDVWAASTAYDHRGTIITDRRYRENFDRGGYPNVYTALMYFKKTESAFEFFRTVELVYTNWKQFSRHFPLGDRINCDEAFALAMKLTRHEDYCPNQAFPGITHMKAPLLNLDQIGPKWWESIITSVNPDGTIMVGPYSQRYPFHYHEKDFLTDEMLDDLRWGSLRERD